MVRQNLNKVLEAAEALNDADREELRRQLNARAARQPQLNMQQQLRQVLVEEGLISHTPSRPKDAKRFRSWQPVSIKGKPLSETIIEERR